MLKAGHFAWGAIGEGNASVEGCEPVVIDQHWGSLGAAATSVGTTFVSKAAIDSDLRSRLGSHRRFAAVSDIRSVRRDSLLANTATAAIDIDPTDGTVRLDGRLVACEPTGSVPLSRRYLLS